jgi:alkylated DNA repair dioxygenase AlkB
MSYSNRATPELSPPRKRSTQDLEEDIDDRQPKAATKPSMRRTPSDARPETTRYKVNRARIRDTRSRTSRESFNRPVTPSTLKALAAAAANDPAASPSLASDTDTGSRSLKSPSSARFTSPPTSAPRPMDDSAASKGIPPPEHCARAAVPPRKRKLKPPQLLGPAAIIGSGDSFIRAPIIAPDSASSAFYTLQRTIPWQKMFHRSGEVPRLVAVQGATDPDDGSQPIYRHPVDKSPAMEPFDETVDTLRAACEKEVGHELNHVLIQYYRSGEDNISEHSDKTLDVVRGSSIVNLSLGAQRIMMLRTKKEDLAGESNRAAEPAGQAEGLPHADPEATQDGADDKRSPCIAAATAAATTTTTSPGGGTESERQPQRIPLMHNSLFILGPLTNQYWLHSVRADKRPSSQKAPEELAYGGERISLTFRQIGTWVDRERGRIWGQGARGKERRSAGRILNEEKDGKEARMQGEEMLRAFGRENHQGGQWEWEREYGRGFDVVDASFETQAG